MPILSDEKLASDYGWSDTARRIFRSKYLRRAGVPQPGPADGLGFRADSERLGGEEHIDQALQRLAGAWAEWGYNGDYFTLEESAVFEAEILDDLRHRRAFPNSPQWFNTGLYEAYGIESGDGGFALDGQPAKAQHAQVHACFIQSVEDNLCGPLGIKDLEGREGRVFKLGSGTGTLFSTLRGRGEPLRGGGTSSGMISFLAASDAGAGAIKSGGTTRRAAKMVVCDLDHLDALDLIRYKARGEDEALAMAIGARVLRDVGQAPYLPEISLGWNADESAYTYAQGQNANFSIRLDGAAFFALCDADAHFTLRGRASDITTTIPARRLRDEIAQAAWYSADPGIQFDDLIQAMHTSPSMGRINASNPCSEYLFADDTACNLASIRLSAFLREDGTLDEQGLAECARRWARILDISVSGARYPTALIAERTRQSRTIGLGPMDLGGALIRAGLRYDEDKGRKFAARCMAIVHGAAGYESQVLADKLGPCDAWRENREAFERVWNAHAGAFQDLFDDSVHYWPVEDGPFRNAQWTVCAPTGTIGLASGSCTTGIEPLYARSVVKTLAGGGSITLDADCVQAAPDERAIVTATELSWISHLKMVAALQPFVSGGISKTLNLPASTTPDEIAQIYRKAWDLGVKCVSVYRDGSKHSQVLGGGDPDDRVREIVEGLRKPVRVKPAGVQGATRWTARIGHEAVYLTLAGDNPKAPTQLRLDHGSAGSRDASSAEAISKLASLALQYGVPLEALAETLTDIAGGAAGFVQGGSGTVRSAGSVAAWAGREILAYLGTAPTMEADTVAPAASDACPSCGGAVQNAGTCKVCSVCGHSLGGCG